MASKSYPGKQNLKDQDPRVKRNTRRWAQYSMCFFPQIYQFLAKDSYLERLRG